MEKEPNNKNEGNKPTTEIMDNLRTEYGKAQESAEHHDQLLWYVTSIVWTGNIIVLGQIATSDEIRLSNILVLFVGIIALVLNLFLWVASFQFRWIRNQKYKFCKQIEDNLQGMQGQHKNLCYPPGVMWTLYCFVTVLFLVVWFAILLIAASNILC